MTYHPDTVTDIVGPPHPPPEEAATLRWKIDKDLELYQFYLDVSVKAAVFLMTVTGAIASYVLANAPTRVSSVALAFPAIMNTAFAVLFFYSIGESKRLFQLHQESCRTLGVSEFNMNPLRALCQILSLMCGVAAAGLLVLLVVFARSPRGTPLGL